MIANVRAVLSLLLRGFGGALMVPGWVLQRLADRIDRV